MHWAGAEGFWANNFPFAEFTDTPHTRTLHLSYGPPSDNHFTTYRL